MDEKRARLVMANPNEHTMRYLQEFLDEAISNDDQERINEVKQAMESLKKFPFTLRPGMETIFTSSLLQQIGKRLSKEKNSKKEVTAGAATSFSDCNPTLPEVDVEPVAPEEFDDESQGGICSYVPQPPLDLGHPRRVILYGDTQESAVNDSLKARFAAEHLTFVVRRLKVGDFVWVVQGPKDELVLPLICERKRLDDFAKSLIDGRLSEQRFRLLATGVPRVLYLIENHRVRNMPKGLPQAVSSTMVRPRVLLVHTESPEETVEYLTNTTKLFNQDIQTKTITKADNFLQTDFNSHLDTWYLPEFEDFFKSSAKMREYTSSEMLTKHLLQLHGVSADKACAISSKYGSVHSLIKAFSVTGPSLLSNLEYGLNQRKIGPLISSQLCKFYCS